MALPGDGFLEFAEPPGDEALLVVATEKPVTDRDVLARVLTKKPGEADTPEEEAVRKTIKATVSKALKSARERKKEIMNNMVMYRGLTSDAAMKTLVDDVHTRGVSEGTIEEPSHGEKSGHHRTVRQHGEAGRRPAAGDDPAEVVGEMNQFGPMARRDITWRTFFQGFALRWVNRRPFGAHSRESLDTQLSAAFSRGAVPHLIRHPRRRRRRRTRPARHHPRPRGHEGGALAADRFRRTYGRGPRRLAFTSDSGAAMLGRAG